MIIDSPIILNSLVVSGSHNHIGDTSVSGNLTVTGSIIGTATSASYATTLGGKSSSEFTLTSSFNSYTSSNDSSVLSATMAAVAAAASAAALTAKTSSYATTGSNTFVGNQTTSGSLFISGSVTLMNTLTAQTLVVQTITSSVDFVTGSTRFGSLSGNTHVFTGSMNVSGSVGIGTTPNSTLHVRGDNGTSTSAVLRLRDTNTTARTTRLQFEDYAGTLADGLIDFRIGTAGNASTATLSIGINSAGLTFNSSNAATFASTVTATNGIFSENSGNVILQALKTGATNATTAVIRQTGAGGNGSQDIGLLVDIQGANDSDRIANFRYYDGSTYASRLAIQRGGNVGIGTETPSANGLTIYRDGGDRKIMLELNRPNTAGLQSAIQFTVGNNIMVGQIQHEYAASNQNHMSFSLRSPGGSNFVSLWLQNDGNIGMGTSSPYSKLDVRGPIAIGGGATYPLNVKFVKQGTTSITFTALLGTIGAWRPGHAMIKVSGGQNGLQEYWAAWFYIRMIGYVGSGVICSVVDSGGDTGSVSFSYSDNTSSPQTVNFILTDSGGTTNTMIADIDLTYNEGIVSIS
jgi:hypothetical protein